MPSTRKTSFGWTFNRIEEEDWEGVGEDVDFMTRRVIAFFVGGLFFQSCGFLFYNYRGFLDTEFSITNNGADTTIRHQVGKLISRLSNKEHFYHHYSSVTFDSLYFYGPDYHRFRFKIYEKNQATKVHLFYSGYNGFRRRPPHKQFIQSLTDSLKLKFGATQIVTKNISNEKM